MSARSRGLGGRLAGGPRVAAVLLAPLWIACGSSAPPARSAPECPPCEAGSETPREQAPRAPASNAAACREAGLAVQVLGSGGPILDDERASSGYLVWVGGRARLMVDAGPGTMHRFGRTGARIEDLDALLLTHFHVDHSADVAGFLKTASFGERSAPLPVRGPTGDGPFPDVDGFLAALLAEDGAYHYLGGFSGDGQPFALAPEAVDAGHDATSEVFANERLRVRAVGVPHGPVPALAYEVTVGDTRIAFMGDQRADTEAYAELVRGVDLLVAHMAIDGETSGPAARLHATPARLGEVAAEAEVGRMVLSHLMRRALDDLDANLEAIRSSYDGPLEVAEDGTCLVLR
ncbi:MAG TPA: MBL fold metallo-hydrolase [Sandaracinaceae bacterium LLY-WYZ-13_1]|nr:MBL fold metallo-hydrolase [Sandaracinaceae bacterium LLY-WYZ-13_1]